MFLKTNNKDGYLLNISNILYSHLNTERFIMITCNVKSLRGPLLKSKPKFKLKIAR